ncbi:twin-arginine translocase subunit TatC [Actinomyces vulturis]|uniref:twin-arginine translocase subunit TatC n=1 Tax=Actinomyces vulturis TaxID=1857645 RepID=UPI00082A1458
MAPRLKVSKVNRKENPEARMPIGDHLRELRDRAILVAIGLVVGTIVGWFFYDWFFDLLFRPIAKLMEDGREATFNFPTITAAFDMKFRISFWMGVVMTSPFWMYHIWAYLAPGLTKKEKKYAWGFGGAGLILFLAGAWMAWWIMPHAVEIFAQFAPKHMASFFLHADQYLTFIIRLMIAFGVAFLFPEFMVGLNFLGLVKGKTMLKGWRYAVVVIFVFMAIANPLPDPLPMILTSLPVCGLYFGACGIAIYNDKRVAKKRAKEEAELNAALAEAEAKERAQREAREAELLGTSPVPAVEAVIEPAALPTGQSTPEVKETSPEATRDLEAAPKAEETPGSESDNNATVDKSDTSEATEMNSTEKTDSGDSGDDESVGSNTDATNSDDSDESTSPSA